MKSSGNPPPPPDPTTSANAQSAANIQTAIANARLNRVNQTTPWGSINYTQGPPDANGVPTYSSNITLSPQQQALLEQQQGGQLTRAQLANQVLANSGANIAKPLDLSHLQSVYDPYSSNHQWDPSPTSFNSPSAAPPAAGGPAAAPASSAASAGPTAAANPGQLAALASMLRSGMSSAPAGDLDGGRGGANPDGALKPLAMDNANPLVSGAASVPHGFGTAGDMSSLIGTSKPDLSKLPPEIAAQLQDEVKVDEGGTQTHNYNFNENPGGGFKGSDGKYYVQVGQNKLKDPSKVKFDPAMGDVTEAGNVVDPGIGGLRGALPFLAAFLAGGAGLTAMGAGAAAGAGAEGAAGAAGAEGAAGAAGASGSGLTPLTGVTLAPETTIGTVGEFGGTAGGASTGAALGNYAPVTDLSVQAQQPSIWQNMLTNAQNGRGLLGYGNGATQGAGSLLSQLLRSGQQQGGKR